MALGWVDVWFFDTGRTCGHPGGLGGVSITSSKQWYLASPAGNVVACIHKKHSGFDGGCRYLCACYRRRNSVAGDNVSVPRAQVI